MRIVVAMSGGVDSSVAAALLKKQGHEVIGVSMQIWGDYTAGCDERSCCSPTHLDDARAVAEQVGIPYYVLNFRQEFERRVVNYFCREYLAGRTPNPCIYCNHELKFKTLWQRAETLGADYVASGHYARIVPDTEGGYVLKRGIDLQKDQSYFLFSLEQEMLGHTLFPLGEYKKNQVRELAQSLGLKVAAKKESQEICFVPSSGYRKFLQQRCAGQLVKGDILDRQGRKLGEHRGIGLYTIGQRHGLGLSAPNSLYVIGLDPRQNTVTVGEEAALYQPCLLAKGGNLERFTQPLKVQAQIRYRHQPAAATVYPLDRGQVLVEFEKPQRAITPGQAAVFYQGDILLGGGWIEQGGTKEQLCRRN